MLLSCSLFGFGGSSSGSQAVGQVGGSVGCRCCWRRTLNGLGQVTCSDWTARVVDDGLEAILVVGGVFDGSHAAIGFYEAVVSVHNVTIAYLILCFDVASLWVVDVVFERVLGRLLLFWLLGWQSGNTLRQSLSYHRCGSD